MLDRQPVTNADIAAELRREGAAPDVVPLTAELQRAALIEQLAEGPEGWRLTAEGRHAVGLP